MTRDSDSAVKAHDAHAVVKGEGIGCLGDICRGERIRERLLQDGAGEVLDIIVVWAERASWRSHWISREP